VYSLSETEKGAQEDANPQKKKSDVCLFERTFRPLSDLMTIICVCVLQCVAVCCSVLQYVAVFQRLNRAVKKTRITLFFFPVFPGVSSFEHTHHPLKTHITLKH